MATNAYCSGADAKLAMDVDDEDDDITIDLATETASRNIDAHCGKGRKFWQDSTAVARTFYPSEARRVYVDDFATTTNLTVKVDLDDDGTYETTLTQNTDFILEPVNAAADGRPWESIRLLDGTLSTFSALSSGRPFVQVTAKWGFAATTPVAVKQATIIQTRSVWKAIQTQNSGVQLSVEGQLIRTPVTDPVARLTLERFIRYTPVDDGA